MNERYQADAVHLFERRLDARPRWLRRTRRPRFAPRSLVVGRHFRGSAAFWWRPMLRRDLDFQVRDEVGHIVFDPLDGDALAHSWTPRSSAQTSQISGKRLFGQQSQ